MSPIYGAVILWLATVILWWTGWKEETAGELPWRAVAIFLSSWPLFVGWSLQLSATLSLQGAWVWTIALMVAVACGMEASWRWTAVSAGLLFCAIYLVLQRLSYYPHDWSKLAAPWGAALLIGGLAAVLLKDAPAQLLSLSVAIALSEGINALVNGAADILYGGATLEWMRNWWVAVLFARLCALLIHALLRIRRTDEHKFSWRRGGERS